MTDDKIMRNANLESEVERWRKIALLEADRSQKAEGELFSKQWDETKLVLMEAERDIWKRRACEAYEYCLRNSASAVIRALMERVRDWQDDWDYAQRRFTESDARITHLESEVERWRKIALLMEAERDIWRERAQRHGIAKNYDEFGPLDPTPYPTPTPEEIAARVEQNRKERG